ncbi:MAG: hypothetical protein C4289_02780 [Chloroflexota bacterium]
MPGKFFDDLEIGQTIKHATGRTVGEMDNVLFCALTMNTQPLHLNEDFASKTQFGRRIVNGIFTLGLLVGLTVPELTEGTIIANLSYEKVVHPHPMFHGDTLYVESEVLEKRAASILQPDLSHAGGIMETRIIAGMAEAYYVGIAPHCPLGPIALAACLQLDACIPNFVIQEGGRITGEGYITQPFCHENGYMPLPQGPGLGVELDEEALADKIGHDWQNPKRFAEDGSAIDW